MVVCAFWRDRPDTSVARLVALSSIVRKIVFSPPVIFSPALAARGGAHSLGSPLVVVLASLPSTTRGEQACGTISLLAGSLASQPASQPAIRARHSSLVVHSRRLWTTVLPRSRWLALTRRDSPPSLFVRVHEPVSPYLLLKIRT